MNDHERGFLEFLVEPSRRRIKALLELGEKRRRDVRSQLDHAVRLDPRFSQHLTGGDASSATVEAELRKLGAPAACHVLAADSGLDGREMPLRVALGAIIGMGNGAFVSCIPGRLGFYAYESPKSSYLLSKPPAKDRSGYFPPKDADLDADGHDRRQGGLQAGPADKT